MVRSTDEEAPQGWPLLHLTQTESQADSQSDQQVDGEADGRQQWAEQPEALAEALSFAGLDALRGPHRRD